VSIHTDLGSPTLGDELGRTLVPASRLGQEARDDAAQEHSRPPQKDRSVLEQLLHNLMLTLGVPHA
jgi:hypothetical protein